MKKFIYKTCKQLLALLFIIFSWWILIVWEPTFAQSSDKVPDYYYANYRFIDDLEMVWSIFNDLKAYHDLWDDEFVDSSTYAELARHFNNVFPYLTKNFSTTYKKCSALAESLAVEYDSRNVSSLLWNSCYKPLNDNIRKVNWGYTVVAEDAKWTPESWNAPLSVTFTARDCKDPSGETIPLDNYFWFYRDEKWVDRVIWRWITVNYTFKESWTYVVHLVVRSSNVDEWYLDWEKNITIKVLPKVADIVVYANTRKMATNSPMKIWLTEWLKGIVFDWSLTRPKWATTIASHRWEIVNRWTVVYDSKYEEWAPGVKNVQLYSNWEYKVTLYVRDNEKTEYSESYYLYISDPVTIIKQNPTEWTTSTIFNFDASSSYSITNKIDTYVWELFDWNWEEEDWKRVYSEQWKKINIKLDDLRKKPWDYMIRLTVTDAKGISNTDSKNIYIESTPPVAQFTIKPTNKWTYPSEFLLDASNSSDVDELNGFDSLHYSWSFWSNNAKIVSTEEDNKKVVVQFDEIGKYRIELTVTDQYWKSSIVSQTIDVESVLRPEIELQPMAIKLWLPLDFISKVNKPVVGYSWDFWDNSSNAWEHASKISHEYKESWIYNISLSVNDKDDFNTVKEKVFIWEINSPIAAYRIKDVDWNYIQDTDTCRIEYKSWNFNTEPAYPIDRYQHFTIDPSISINTKWNSNWLDFTFSKEQLVWSDKIFQNKRSLNESFNQLWCHYIDLAVYDQNGWGMDKTRIWFNVKNAAPELKNLTLTYPQYADNGSFTLNNGTDKTMFDCTWANNLTIKVTAVEAKDPDWTISRLRFYYYNVDDPSRLLDYKDTWINVPYAYFVLPRIAWEYKFWVMISDNDWGTVDSSSYLSSNPSVYFPNSCGDAEVPIVTLKEDSKSVQVWDSVKLTIASRITTNNPDFETDRTFYYDFTWDWTWDLVSKKDTETYQFTEAYEDWVSPRAAVEYRWKLWQAAWDKIIVKNWIKPILLSNSIWNKVIFRDLSIWTIQNRKICFEEAECEAWNKRYQRSTTVTENEDWTTNSIKDKDSFIIDYPNYWTHEISIYLKNTYWAEAEDKIRIRTTPNIDNWKIASWINMITIPETTLNNTTPEIFLSKNMDNTLLMYLYNESWETCYIDTDISTDSDFDGKTDNDSDVDCNKLAKIVYEPNYENAIWRIYFTNKWKLTFKNYYITFEWYVSELDEEKYALYEDISILVNGIEDLTSENTDLKMLLDRLRRNLNNAWEVTSLILTINEKIAEWWIKLDASQKELLDHVISSLSSKDTVIAVWKSDYEKNKAEILELVSASQRETVESLFKEFEEANFEPEGRADSLNKIREFIIDISKKNNRYDEEDYTPYFCNIFDFYKITNYTTKCWSDAESLITKNYNKEIENPSSSSSSWLPLWLKIILIILVWWLLVMWWIIVFFSVKARLNSSSESDDEW